MQSCDRLIVLKCMIQVSRNRAVSYSMIQFHETPKNLLKHLSQPYTPRDLCMIHGVSYKSFIVCTGLTAKRKANGTIFKTIKFLQTTLRSYKKYTVGTNQRRSLTLFTTNCLSFVRLVLIIFKTKIRSHW